MPITLLSMFPLSRVHHDECEVISNGQGLRGVLPRYLPKTDVTISPESEHRKRRAAQ